MEGDVMKVSTWDHFISDYRNILEYENQRLHEAEYEFYWALQYNNDSVNALTFSSRPIVGRKQQ